VGGLPRNTKFDLIDTTSPASVLGC